MKTASILGILLLLGSLLLAGCGDRVDASPVDQYFTLRAGMVAGRMAYIGVGGTIDSLANPDLTVKAGAQVRIELINDDGAAHDLALPELGRQTPLLMGQGKTASFTFKAGASGTYPYFCTVSGHRQAGMEGRLVVTP